MPLSRSHWFCLGLAAGLLIVTNAAAARAQGASTIGAAAVIGRAAGPLVLDGAIDESAWAAARPIELRYQVSPGDNVAASERTEVRLLYDASRLWIAVHAWDSSPAGIRARVAKRDDIGADDSVLITIDTDNARQRAYQFQFNPLGIQADAIYTVAGGGDYAWDGVFTSKGRLTADGYVIEASVPFNTMRFRSAADMTWALHVERWIARKAERTSWQRQSRDNASFLGQMGLLNGLGGVTRSHALDLTPTLTGAAGRERASAAVPLSAASRGEFGVTGVYGLTSNLSLSATVNPDFSQVEADVPQLTVNQRFNISYTEKRPFFLEGSEFFRSALSSGLRALDTRTIVDPDWGVKLTGKSGANSIGLLAASDAAPAGANALVGAARYQRDIFVDSALAGSVVSRTSDGSSNTVVTGEARFRFKKVTTIGLQAVRSDTETDGRAFGGTAYRIASTTSARTWKLYFWDQFVSRDFRALSGFVSHVGYHELHGDVGYEWRPKTPSWWTSFWPYILSTRSFDANGDIEYEYVDPSVQLTLPKGVQVMAFMSFDHDRFANRDLRYRFFSGSATVNRFKWLSLSASANVGGGVRFDPADPQVGDARELSQTVTIRPSNALTIGGSFTHNRIASRVDGATLTSQDLFRQNVNWQFARSHAVRWIADYDSASRRLGLSLLYSFTPSPNTAVYAGYNDLLLRDIGDPAGRASGADWPRLRRTLFVKLSYGYRR